MNKEEILAMEAGEKLNSLTHEVVMGLCDHSWVVDKRFKEDYHYRCTKCKRKFNSAGHFLLPQKPSYSTDISAAWQMMERMSQLARDMWLLLYSSGVEPILKIWLVSGWYCDFRLRGEAAPAKYVWVDHQKTAPEAICKAALLATIKES